MIKVRKRKRAGRKRRTRVLRDPNGRIARQDNGPVILPATLRQRATALCIPTGCEANTAIEAIWYNGWLGEKYGIGKQRQQTLERYRTLWVEWSAMAGSRRWRADQIATGLGLLQDVWRKCDDKMAACNTAIIALPCHAVVIEMLDSICLRDVVPPMMGHGEFTEFLRKSLISGVGAVEKTLTSPNIIGRIRTP